jgi:hypothetical protein
MSNVILVILLVQRKVGVKAQVFLKLPEPFLGLRARKQFLADRTQHFHRVGPDQTLKFPGQRIVLGPVPSQELGPDTRIHQDPHSSPGSVVLALLADNA